MNGVFVLFYESIYDRISRDGFILDSGLGLTVGLWAPTLVVRVPDIGGVPAEMFVATVRIAQQSKVVYGSWGHI